MRLIIPGDPIPKARHRTFVRGKRSISWDPQDQQKEATRKIIQKGKEQYFSGKTTQHIIEFSAAASYHIKYLFLMETNKTDHPSIKNLKYWNVLPQICNKDLSNRMKYLEDCMNGIIYVDDSMISSSELEQEFSESPCTIIDISVKICLDVSNQTKEVLKLMSPNEMEAFFSECYELQVIGLCPTIPLESKTRNIKQFADKWAKIIYKIAKIKDSEPYSTGKPLS